MTHDRNILALNFVSGGELFSLFICEESLEKEFAQATHKTDYVLHSVGHSVSTVEKGTRTAGRQGPLQPKAKEELKSRLDAHGEAKQRSLGRMTKDARP